MNQKFINKIISIIAEDLDSKKGILNKKNSWTIAMHGDYDYGIIQDGMFYKIKKVIYPPVSVTEQIKYFGYVSGHRKSYADEFLEASVKKPSLIKKETSAVSFLESFFTESPKRDLICKIAEDLGCAPNVYDIMTNVLVNDYASGTSFAFQILAVVEKEDINHEVLTIAEAVFDFLTKRLFSKYKSYKAHYKIEDKIYFVVMYGSSIFGKFNEERMQYHNMVLEKVKETLDLKIRVVYN